MNLLQHNLPVCLSTLRPINASLPILYGQTRYPTNVAALFIIPDVPEGAEIPSYAIGN
jgi:hypothetical protein